MIFMIFHNTLSISADLSRGLCDYFAHPHDELYYHSLSWEEMCSSCLIIEAFSSHIPTCNVMFNYGTIIFLVKCFYQSRFHFLGSAAVTDYVVSLVLTTVISVSNTLSHFCQASHENSRQAHSLIKAIASSDTMEATCFFLNTLTVNSKSLDSHLKELQIELGLALIGYYDCYVSMILSCDESLATASTDRSYENQRSLLGTPLNDANINRNQQQQHSFAVKQILLLEPVGKAVTTVNPCYISTQLLR